MVDYPNIWRISPIYPSRVIKVVKAQSSEIEDQTGSKPSLTDDEIKEYLDKVLKEIKR